MTLNLVQSVAPSAEPVSLAEAREYLRVDDDRDDQIIEEIVIPAARDRVERYLDVQLMPATYVWKLRGFPVREFVVPRPPLASVTSIVYVDENGTSQTYGASNYVVSVGHVPGIITPVYGTIWPVARAQEAGVTVTYVAGYAAAALIPSGVRMALMMLIAHYYEDRGVIITGTIVSTIPEGVERLLQQASTGMVWA